MPLSEDEQRILSEIEQQLYESDPQLAREVGSTTVYSHPARNLRRSVLLFVVGLGIMVGTLAISYWLAFVGFLVMLAAALIFEQNARRLGRVGLQQFAQNLRMGDAFGGAGQSMRDRFRRDDPS